MGTAGWRRYTVKQFLKAIPDSGGIIGTIADRVGCTWVTAERFIREHPTVQAAYDAERENILDRSESLLFVNIRLQQKEQAQLRRPVDSSDAKWLLSRRGKHRGYTERHEVEDVTERDINAAIEDELARLADRNPAADAGPAEGAEPGE